MITSINNWRVKWVRSLQEKRKARQEERRFVIEGTRLAYEAVVASIPAALVLHTERIHERGRGLVNSLARLGAEVETVTEAVMTACSATESPPGLLAVVSIPQLPPPSTLDLALVADRLSDPGNMGALLRTALAAGAQTVFLTEGTVDPYNPKVVRGAMGAHFRLPVLELPPSAMGDRLEGMQVWVAEPDAGAAYDQVDWSHPTALVIGGEAQGPGEAAWSGASRVHVPMPGGAESLNAAVAAGVILFEIVRQRSALTQVGAAASLVRRARRASGTASRTARTKPA